MCLCVCVRVCLSVCLCVCEFSDAARDLFYFLRPPVRVSVFSMGRESESDRKQVAE